MKTTDLNVVQSRGRAAPVVLVLAMCLALAACGNDPAPQAGAEPAPAQPAAATATAPTTAASPPPPLEILSVLSVENEVDVLAQRAGTVVEVLHDQGSRVKKGSVLARLDDRELMAQIDRARADLAAAESNVRYNEAELAARQAALRRAQQMRQEGLNSDADLEEAEFRAKGAQYDLEAWRSVVQRNHANMRVLELEMEKTRILAPFEGVVVRRYIQLGRDVLKDEKVFRVGQLAPLLVHFLVPENSLQRPQPDHTVEVVLAGDGKRTLPARILRVSPTVDAASGSYDVTAELTGDTSGLRPGMAVHILWPAPPGSTAR